ncbi:hypothetical protein FKX85_19080 [Echinicola soli]|uniref:Uncharacterized protein n=1 Tax=Echinicola soli TaxID=2591634 RepID=A0A514CMH7_9BACT|nr:hypothetical protein [Echinicola soli]QDH81033.1 hypothetical protein FKX85_19080 [Echinicola soli]
MEKRRSPMMKKGGNRNRKDFIGTPGNIYHDYHSAQFNPDYALGIVVACPEGFRDRLTNIGKELKVQ